MDSQPADEAIADLLKSMNRGQFLLFAAAVRHAGGEVRIDPDELSQMVTSPLPRLDVDACDGPVVLRLLE